MTCAGRVLLSRSHDLSAVDADAAMRLQLAHLPKRPKLTEAPRSARAFKHFFKVLSLRTYSHLGVPQ